ncbi:hypothetical protein BF49_3589 [Bradyrhizobium sp.]|uniref:hypothetical protein n=1 Tax=Bradyrhizobium sp. TaxID=376 RepID=UPI0007C1C2D3|nr:hypothetical protein [Bradyrhizobium sp.]CUT12509.1 hypothetical protein BF49_3589 [Bradyrhizobium sp.]
MAEMMSFASRQVANMLAVRAVKHATSFLQGQDGPTLLGMHAEQLQIDLLLADPLANGLLNPVRLLNVAMASAAHQVSDVPAGVIADAALLDRWMHVIGSLVELVQHTRARFAREHGVSA